MKSQAALHVLGDKKQERLVALTAALAQPGLQIRLQMNRNRRLLVTLNLQPGARTISIHHDLLDYPEALADLLQWVRRNGKGGCPSTLRAAMNEVVAAQHSREQKDAPPLPPLPTLGRSCDLRGIFLRLHGAWFAHTPPPTISWSRRHHGSQRHIRFGCYRSKPRPQIVIHPKLDQPWVAVCFVEHVVFHELCHHAQACAPIRGEAMHGRRFRDWERRYPQHELALAWERVYAGHLLDGTSPDMRSAD